MTLPPQGHPQYELRRRIADCRERLRRARTAQKGAERAAHTQAGATDEEGPGEESDDAHGRQRKTMKYKR
jgi:hypothetical protein